jgi:predicted NBD/HSP70 family sugar kinase
VCASGSVDRRRFWLQTVGHDRVVTVANRETTGRADQTTVRQANLRVVLRDVAEHTACSRARIAARTGLTRGTVSSLVAELIELDLLRETGAAAGPRGVGRPGLALELADVVLGVGLEVNVDYVAVCVEDLTGVVHHERRVYRDNRGSRPGPVLDRVAALAREELDAAARTRRRVAGVSLAVPGLVEVGSGTLVFAPNLGWSDVPVASELRARLGAPIHVENEANLAALAEHWSGAARGCDNFICVFGEIGIGGGIVIGGELYRGANGFGGELGHVAVERDGLPCACGSHGCLETRAGEEAIARAAGLPATTGRTRSIADELLRRAQAGDRDAVAAAREAGAWLGVGLATALNLLDLEAVVLGGCFGVLAPWLADDVAATLRQRSMAARSASFRVLPSVLGEGAAVRGAAALPLRRVLDAPCLADIGAVPVRAAV